MIFTNIIFTNIFLDLGRKIFRNSLNRRTTDASVKEEENEENDDDNDDNDHEHEHDDEHDENEMEEYGDLPKITKQKSNDSTSSTNSVNGTNTTGSGPPRPFLQRFTQSGTLSKITIISPSLLSNSPLPEKKTPVSKPKPKPLIKSSTVSPGMGTQKLIRQTLKELHDKSPENSPNASPVVTHRKSAKLNAILNHPPASSSPSLPQGLNSERKVFSRGSTDSQLNQSIKPNSNIKTNSDLKFNSISNPSLEIAKQSRSISDDDIPGPPSEPPPKDSPDVGRKRLNSGKYSRHIDI